MANTFIRLASAVVAAATGAAVARSRATRAGAGVSPPPAPPPRPARTSVGGDTSEAIDAARDRLRARADAGRDHGVSRRSGEHS